MVIFWTAVTSINWDRMRILGGAEEFVAVFDSTVLSKFVIEGSEHSLNLFNINKGLCARASLDSIYVICEPGGNLFVVSNSANVPSLSEGREAWHFALLGVPGRNLTVSNGLR